MSLSSLQIVRIAQESFISVNMYVCTHCYNVENISFVHYSPKSWKNWSRAVYHASCCLKSKQQQQQIPSDYTALYHPVCSWSSCVKKHTLTLLWSPFSAFLVPVILKVPSTDSGRLQIDLQVPCKMRTLFVFSLCLHLHWWSKGKMNTIPGP